MNKLFNKIAVGIVSIAMAIGVGVAIGSNGGFAFANAAGSSEWEQVTDYSDLDTSSSYVVANNAAKGNYFNGSVSSGHLQTSAFSASNPASATAAGVFKLEAVNASNYIYKIKLVSTSKYVDASKAASGGFRIDQSSDSNGWRFVKDSDGNFDAIYQKSYSGSYASMRCYNNTSFRSYASGKSDEYSGSNGTVFRIYKYQEVVSCNVTLNKNGGSGGTNSVTATKGSAMPTLASAPTRTGYTFAGYYDAQTGGTQYYTASRASARNWDKNGTTATLWAHWTAKTSALTFNLNGGTGTAPTGKTATYGQAMPSYGQSAPTLTGYTFAGFYDGAGGTGTQYYTSSLASARTWDKDITTGTILYAKWTINSYTVGGTISDGHLSSTADVDYNDPLSITIVPDQDYTYPSSIDSVTMGGAAYAGYTYDSTDGSFYIEHVTGNVVINADCVSSSATERFFTYHLSHCSIENAPASMYDTEMKLLQIVADDHYKFPSSITVTGISAENWEYDADEGTILINEPDGDIDLTVSCAPKAQNTISMGTLTGVSAAGGNPTTVEEGATVTLTFTANSGYGLPTSDDVTVTGTGSSFVWTQGTGKLQITGGTGNITVSIIGIRRDLTDSSLTLGTKKTSYTTGDDFELPSTVTANFNIAPLTANVKNDVVVSGPVAKNSSKYIVTGSGTITLTYTYEPTGSSQSASYAITATPITPTTEKFVKVTSGTVTSGKYLIVNETASVAFNGGIDSASYDVTSNTVSVSIANNEIAYSSAMDAASFTFDSTAGTLRSAAGYYIYRNGTSTGVTAQTDVPSLTTSITVSNGNAVISNVKDSSTMRLRYNNSSGQDRFRYYSGDSVQAIQIYKYQGATVKELKWITATVKSGTYYKGTSVTASNFDVIGHYNDGSTQAITSSITVTDGYLANIGSNTVTLTYNNSLSCTATVTAVQAPVSTLSVDPTSASIGLNENYNLSNVTVTVTPSYAINTYTWALIDAGGLVEETDYTFENDVYHSINPGTVVFRCTSTADASKFADFTLFISGNPEIHITESSFTGYAGKGDVLHFTYMNIAEDKLSKITFTSSAPSVVDLADGPDAGSGSGTVELEYKSAGTATISVSYDGGSTLDTVSVTVSNDRVVSVTWSATNLDIWSGATLSTTGWNVQYEMASGDSGDADSYTIKLGSETVTAGYVFKAEDDGKTIHVEYGGVSSSSISVTVTQRINNVLKPNTVSNTVSWTATSADNLGGKISEVGGKDTGTISTGGYSWDYTRTFLSVATGKSDNISFQGDTWIQLGSNNSMESLELVTDEIPGTIKSVTVVAATAGSHVLTIDVGGTKYFDGESLHLYSGTAAADNPDPSECIKTGTGSSSGTISISITPTGSTNKALVIQSISVTYEIESGEKTNIANNESHKEAQRKVVEFANYMNTTMNGENVCTGSFANLQTAWTSVATKYNQLFGTGTTLSETELAWAKDLLKNATAEWGSEEENACLEKAMKTYEFCIAKHGLTPFMYEADGTTPLRSVMPAHSFNLLSKNSSAVATVVIISIVSVAAIGGYFYLRKKKED